MKCLLIEFSFVWKLLSAQFIFVYKTAFNDLNHKLLDLKGLFEKLHNININDLLPIY